MHYIRLAAHSSFNSNIKVNRWWLRHPKWEILIELGMFVDDRGVSYVRRILYHILSHWGCVNIYLVAVFILPLLFFHRYSCLTFHDISCLFSLFLFFFKCSLLFCHNSIKNHFSRYHSFDALLMISYQMRPT